MTTWEDRLCHETRERLRLQWHAWVSGDRAQISMTTCQPTLHMPKRAKDMSDSQPESELLLVKEMQRKRLERAQGAYDIGTKIF